MAKGKKKISRENEETQGQTNLGFELGETGDIVKTKSKEDISTLNKNLAENQDFETENNPSKLSKKKKFKEKNSAEKRIENDLFDGRNEEKGEKKRKKKRSKKSLGQNVENIELAPMQNEVNVEDEEDDRESKINDKFVKSCSRILGQDFSGLTMIFPGLSVCFTGSESFSRVILDM